MSNDDDAAIAEFHAAARRHKAKVYGIGGLVGLLLGAAAIVVTVISSEGRERLEVRVMAFGFAFAVLGLFFLFQAWRIGTGRANDFDYDPR